MIDNVDDSLIERLWHDLDGQVSLEQIRRAVTEIAAEYQEAKLTTFVPIFIHRKALRQLKKLLVGQSHPVASIALADDE